MKSFKKCPACSLTGLTPSGSTNVNTATWRLSIQFFFLILLPVCLLFSCSGSNAANAVSDSSSFVSSSSSGSGDDMYYELTTTSTGKNRNSEMITEMYVSAKGDMRVQMHVKSAPNGTRAPMLMVLIGHADKPGESIMIDDSAKIYSIHQIDTVDVNTGFKTETSVTRVGEDRVLSFNSVHAKIISHKKIGSFYNITDTMDVWRSKDVPMQANVKALFSQYEARTGSYMYSKETAASLKQMGCEGFLVKMTLNGKDYSMVMQLTKAEHRNLPADMFQIPAGYRENKNGI